MNKFYSVQPVQPENGSKAKESFKFVSEGKRDERAAAGEEPSQPSCCLSVKKIYYTVR